MGRRGGLLGVAIVALVWVPACGDGGSNPSRPAADAGSQPDGGKESPCGDGAIARLDYPYAPAALVWLFDGRTAFSDARGLTLFVGASPWRTNGEVDTTTIPSQILVGSAFDRLSLLHSERLLNKSAVDGDYVYFGGLNVNRIRRDGSGSPERLVTETTSGKIVLDGDMLYYETSSSIKRMPKAGGTAELIATRPSQFLMSLLSVVDGTVTWFESHIDGQAESVFRQLRPGAATPEVIGRLPPGWLEAYPALSPEGDLYFLAVDATTMPPRTSSLQVLRAGRSTPEPVDDSGLPPLLLDGQNLYYRIPTGAIVKRPRSGGATTEVFRPQNIAPIVALLPMGSDLYLFGDSGCIYRSPK